MTPFNPDSQTALASGGTAALVVIGFAACEEETDALFSTASPAFDDTVQNAGGTAILGYKIYNKAPADHTIDIDHLGQSFDVNALQTGYLEVG